MKSGKHFSRGSEIKASDDALHSCLQTPCSCAGAKSVGCDRHCISGVLYWRSPVVLEWSGAGRPLDEIAVIISIDLSIGILGRIWMDHFYDHQAGGRKSV